MCGGEEECGVCGRGEGAKECGVWGVDERGWRDLYMKGVFSVLWTISRQCQVSFGII